MDCLEYPKDFRIIPETEKYEYVPPCGSDETRVEFCFTPHKRGIFRLKKVKYSRIEKNRTDIYFVFII